MALPAQATRNDGRDWWQEIPDSWDVVELRRVAEISASNVDKNRSASEVPVRLCNYTDVYYNDMIVPDLEFMEATATPREIEKFELYGGEVLLTKDSETAEDIAVPAYVSPGLENVVCGYHLYVVRPHPERLDGRFLQRACSVSPVRDQFVVAANGITRYGLGHESLGAARVPVPPLPVQSAIANFLDRKTAQIDRLFGRKERLIELLEKKRTALITRAVTKGLDPDVEMKDSGVEWLGEIPAHWGVVNLKRTWRRVDYGLSESLAGPGSVPVLTMGNIQDGRIFLPNEGSLEPPSVPVDLYLREGDLLYNRTNSLALVGKVGLVEGELIEPVTFASYLVRMRLRDSEAPLYFRYLLNTPDFLRFAQSHALLSINQANLNPTRYGALPVPRPPLSEQIQIHQYLNALSGEIRDLEKSVEEALLLLQDYRTALISAAVTGKIDVREEAA